MINDEDLLIACAICGEFMRPLEIQDNETGKIAQTLACPNCWQDPIMAGDLLFGKYRPCE